MPAPAPITGRAPKVIPPADAPRRGTQFEVYTAGGIICIGGGWFSSPGTGLLVPVPGVWTGHDVRSDGWAIATVSTDGSGNVTGVMLGFAPGPADVVPGPVGDDYPLPLAVVASRNILPVLAGHPLVFSPPRTGISGAYTVDSGTDVLYMTFVGGSLEAVEVNPI